MLESLFKNKVVAKVGKFIKKEAPIQIISCEFSKTFTNTFFMEHLSQLLLDLNKHDSTTSFEN